MQLKKISILGFKSFADKTLLNFDSGITCIVGPNGCGKSNISDAFRWVLGEQSAKSMRGNKMPDVIFAGTTDRKPLNFAEVSLTLTDIKGNLPIDYEEITITRRLHRSGESDYLLNGNSVRLKDLQDLFLGSGVGRNAFSIFEQGKLDQVISYSPQERRYIFEEAAGILRFLQRKKEALRKLEQSELNLSRLKDIYSEVEKQIESLQVQAKKARQYKDQKNELENLEKANLLNRWQNLEKKQKDFFTKKQNLENCLIEFQDKRSTNQSAFKHLRSQVKDCEIQYREKTEELINLRSQQEILVHECQTFQLRLKETQHREKKLKQELEDLLLAKETRRKTFLEINKKKESLEGEWSEAETKWNHQKERVIWQEKEVLKTKDALESKQRIYLKALQQHSQQQSEIKQAEVRLENLLDHQKRYENQMGQIQLDYQTMLGSLKEKKQHLNKISSLVDTHKDRLEQFEDELKQLAGKREEYRNEIEKIKRKVIENKARQKILLRMREDLEGFSSGSKKLLQESQNPQSEIYNTLAPFYEYIKAKDGPPEAIAIILGKYSQTLIAQSEKDVKRILNFAQKEAIQDFSIVCLEWIERQTPSVNSSSLLNRVDVNSLSKHYLGRVSCLKDDHEIFDINNHFEHLEYWTEDGSYIDFHKTLFKLEPSQNQIFLRENELTSLEEELLSNENECAELEEHLTKIEHKRAHLQLERVELDKIVRREEMKLVEANVNLQRHQADLEKNQKLQLATEEDLQKALSNYEVQSKSFTILEGQFNQGRQELIRLEEEKNIFEKDLANQENALRILQQDQKEKGTFYHQLAEDRQHILHQFQLLESKEQNHDVQVLRIEEEIDEIKEQQVKWIEEEKNGQLILIEMGSQIECKAQEQANLDKHKESLIKQSEEAENHWRQDEERLHKIEQEVGQIDIQYTHQQSLALALEEELKERYQLSIEEAATLHFPSNRSIEQTERQIKSLRHSVQQFGDVNLTAIEDLEKQETRQGFLKQQLDDMQHSKIDLINIIQQLDGESEKLFKETFELIRSNFKKNFQILFNGGEADLELTDSDSILEAGVEITAKPPGKQMRSISLLSGGEKCLTAVALLFAIFEVKPAPFCILDEIDAPLDDTNVERFLNVVKHFVDRCQFLIITHNKRTMAIGDVIFGVSMEEKGVSKLLSLQFAHNDVPEAALVNE